MSIACDALLQMNVADANGTTLTSSILNTGNIGAADSFTLTPGTPTGFTVEAYRAGMAAQRDFVVAGVGTVTTAGPFRAIGIDHAHNFIYWEQFLSPQHQRAATMFGWILFAVPNEGTSSELYDYWGFFGESTGEHVVLQLNSGSGIPSGGYAINIEVNPGGGTAHSANIALVPDTVYWCCLKADFTGGTARLNVYDTTGVLVGSVTVAQTTGENIGFTRIGNGENGTNAGHVSYLQCLGLDWSVAAFPISPIDSGFRPDWSLNSNRTVGLGVFPE